MNDKDYVVALIRSGFLDPDLELIREALAERYLVVLVADPGKTAVCVIGDRVKVSNRGVPWRQVGVTGFVKAVNEKTVRVVPEQGRPGSDQERAYYRLTRFQQIKGFNVRKKSVEVVK